MWICIAIGIGSFILLGWILTPGNCDVCNVPIKKLSYKWTTQSGRLTVCPNCNRQFEQQRSRAAVAHFNSSRIPNSGQTSPALNSSSYYQPPHRRRGALAVLYKLVYGVGLFSLVAIVAVAAVFVGQWYFSNSPNEITSPPPPTATANPKSSPTTSGWPRSITTPPHSFSWTLVENWNPSGVYARYIVKTSAQNEAELRQVKDEVHSELKGPEAFQVDFLPTAAPTPPALDAMINAPESDKTYDKFDESLKASYSFNISSGLDEMDVYEDRNKKLNVPDAKAFEVYTAGSNAMRMAVVRIKEPRGRDLDNLVKLYEGKFSNPKTLVIYFTSSSEHWRRFPRVYPSEMPIQIDIVYERVNEKARFVPASQFK